MPAVFCITSGTAQERPWGLGRSRKRTFSERFELTKTEMVSPYGQRNSQRCPVRLLWGERQWLGHEYAATKEYSFCLVLSGFDSLKNSIVSVWQAERTEGGWKRRRNSVAFRWTGWLIPLGLKGERSGAAETNMGKRTCRNYSNNSSDQDKECLKNEPEKQFEAWARF